MSSWTRFWSSTLDVCFIKGLRTKPNNTSWTLASTAHRSRKSSYLQCENTAPTNLPAGQLLTSLPRSAILMPVSSNRDARLPLPRLRRSSKRPSGRATHISACGTTSTHTRSGSRIQTELILVASKKLLVNVSGLICRLYLANPLTLVQPRARRFPRNPATPSRLPDKSQRARRDNSGSSGETKPLCIPSSSSSSPTRSL